MNNLIPHFIAEKYKKNIKNGSFTATTLFLDLAGFTKTTEKLLKKDNTGAEILAKLLNNLFSHIINIIYKYDGFITTFAGDAFTAIFPNENEKNNSL